jgi:hypothetical protein
VIARSTSRTDEGVGERLADGQQPVVAQDERAVVAEVGDQAGLLVVVQRRPSKS